MTDKNKNEPLEFATGIWNMPMPHIPDPLSAEFLLGIPPKQLRSMSPINYRIFYAGPYPQPIGGVYVLIGISCSEETGEKYDVYHKIKTGERWLKGLRKMRLPR